jgi:signal transduction protein with GAF and PtsI domain
MKPLYDTPCMRVMQGIAASPGVGLGKAFLYVHERLVTPHVKIEEREVPHEVERFKRALASVATEIAQMAEATPVDNSEKIVETHLLMLHDPEFTKAVENFITTDRLCAEWAVERVLNSVIVAVIVYLLNLQKVINVEPYFAHSFLITRVVAPLTPIGVGWVKGLL